MALVSIPSQRWGVEKHRTRDGTFYTVEGHTYPSVTTVTSPRPAVLTEAFREAGRVGSWVHRDIDDWWSGRPLRSTDNLQILHARRAFISYLSRRRLHREAGETVVWNHQHGYAGTLDLIVRRPDGELVLIDWKTSSHILPHYSRQVLAYARAWEALGHPPVVEIALVRLDKSGAGPEPHTIPPPDWDRHFSDFLEALATWKAVRDAA